MGELNSTQISGQGPHLSHFDVFLSSHGLRLESRAKSASGRVFHWVRVVEFTGREIASSGGWYEREWDATRRALDGLRSLDGFSEIPFSREP